MSCQARAQARTLAPVLPAETRASPSPACDQARGHDDRGVGLGGQGLAGLVVHVDDLGRVVDADPRAVVAEARQGRADDLGVADQDQLGVGQGQRGLGGAGHDLFGGVISTHGVDDDPLHRRPDDGTGAARWATLGGKVAR
jgi:hypothetical protein